MEIESSSNRTGEGHDDLRGSMLRRWRLHIGREVGEDGRNFCIDYSFSQHSFTMINRVIKYRQ